MQKDITFRDEVILRFLWVMAWLMTAISEAEDFVTWMWKPEINPKMTSVFKRTLKTVAKRAALLLIILFLSAGPLFLIYTAEKKILIHFLGLRFGA